MLEMMEVPPLPPLPPVMVLKRSNRVLRMLMKSGKLEVLDDHHLQYYIAKVKQVD
jgi:hypothetical protein